MFFEKHTKFSLVFHWLVCCFYFWLLGFWKKGKNGGGGVRKVYESMNLTHGWSQKTIGGVICTIRLPV